METTLFLYPVALAERGLRKTLVSMHLGFVHVGEFDG